MFGTLSPTAPFTGWATDSLIVNVGVQKGVSKPQSKVILLIILKIQSVVIVHKEKKKFPLISSPIIFFAHTQIDTSLEKEEFHFMRIALKDEMLF